MTIAPSVRKRAKRDSGSVAPSRTAAIGGTRVARMAGRRLAMSVTRIPTRRATTIVLVSKSEPVFGSVKPTRSKSQNSTFASPSPRKRPITEAITPTMSDSTMIELSTCLRDAPIVRSVANSRVRCAIVIESEFAMTNAPTKSATPPNTSRNVWKNEMNSSVSSASLCGLLGRRLHFGVRRAAPPGSAGRAAGRRPRAARRRRSRRAFPAWRRCAERSEGRSRRGSRRRSSTPTRT